GGRARLAVGQIVVLAQGSTRAAARVAALTSETALDGDTYVHAELQPPATSLTGVPLAGLTITAVTQQASANPFDASASLSGSSASITLDRVYPQLHAGDIAVAESAGQLIAATVASTAVVMVPVPVTTPTIRPPHLLIRRAAVLDPPTPAAPATRGETVGNEILGSADASQAFQSFTLKKKPLTYGLDPSAPDRIRAALQVRVNGILWREVPSFFGATATDEVYTVRADPDGTPRITFGDGVRGARPASGVGNITATYRFGAGAAKPPAGTITQIARPVKGLRAVVNPLPARGGADAESGALLRIAAPRSALTLGRAVSLDDFEALARGFPGVVNAAAAWAFDGRLQRATVKIWIISDGGDPSSDLRASLRANADPQVPIVVTLATAVPLDLS